MLSLQLLDEPSTSRIHTDGSMDNHQESDPESSGSDQGSEVSDLVADPDELLEGEEEANGSGWDLIPIVKWTPSKPFDPDSEEFWKRENVVYEAIQCPSASLEVPGRMAQANVHPFPPINDNSSRGLPSANLNPNDLFDMGALLGGDEFGVLDQFDIDTWLNPN